MDFTFCGPNFWTWRWTSDMWHVVELCCSEQSCNRSPWEKDHKSQMVKPILMKPVMLDQGHARLPQYKILEIEEQKFQRYHRNSNRHFCWRNWKIRASCSGSFPPLFSEMEYIGQLHLKRSICLSNQIWNIPSFWNFGFSGKLYISQIRNEDGHLKSVTSNIFLFFQLHQLDDKLGQSKKFQAWKHKISLVL